MLTKELQIHKDCYQCLDMIDKVAEVMPRFTKYTIGKRMLDLIIDICANITHANRVSGGARVEALGVLLENLQVLDTLLHYCNERKFASLKSIGRILWITDNIGKQATGWRNATRNNQNQ